MKKLFVAITAIGLFFTSCKREEQYKLTGNISGQAEGKIYLSKVQDRQMVTIDSTQLQEGAFEFTGVVDSPQRYFIWLDGKKGAIEFYIENSNIDIKADAEKLSEAVIVGSAEHDVFLEYQESQKAFEEKELALGEDYRAARQAQDRAKMDSIQNAAIKMREEMTAVKKDFIANNSTSVVTGFISYVMTLQGMGLEQIEEIYNLLAENVQTSTYGLEIKEKIDILKNVLVGKSAPDFTLNTPEETSFSLSSLKGKIVVIDFWASWCGPCRRENPHMLELYKEVNKRGVEFVGVSVDDEKDKWLKAIEDDGLIWKHVFDSENGEHKVAKMYGIRGIPTTILVDQNGVIVAKSLRSAELKVEIEKLLQ